MWFIFSLTEFSAHVLQLENVLHLLLYENGSYSLEADAGHKTNPQTYLFLDKCPFSRMFSIGNLQKKVYANQDMFHEHKSVFQGLHFPWFSPDKLF